MPFSVNHNPRFRWVLKNFPQPLSPRQEQSLNSLKISLSQTLKEIEPNYPEGFEVVVISHPVSTNGINLSVHIPKTHKKNLVNESAYTKTIAVIKGLSDSIVNDLNIGEICIQPIDDNQKDPKENPNSLEFTAIKPIWGFDDIILSDEIKESLSSVISIIENQNLIFENWGLKKIQPFPKVLLNLSGPPGTGKTMTAHAVAGTLNKNLIEISYEQIESKYVGEGPKNLHKAFSNALVSNAVLFFDEADSLLGKRILNVTEGSEQAINSMRSQMIFELDHYSGLAIFSTNLAQNYDYSFNSRLFHIKYSLPGKEQRKELYKKFLLNSIPGYETVSIDELSIASEGLNGREIRDSILLAAAEIAKSKKFNLLADAVKNSIQYLKS